MSKLFKFHCLYFLTIYFEIETRSLFRPHSMAQGGIGGLWPWFKIDDDKNMAVSPKLSNHDN